MEARPCSHSSMDPFFRLFVPPVRPVGSDPGRWLGSSMTPRALPFLRRREPLDVPACSHSTAIRRRAFTLIELLVVILIALMLVALLLPMLGRGVSEAAKVKCLGNLRQIQAGCVAYAGDNDGRFPSGDRMYGFPHEFGNFSNTLGVYLAVSRDKIMFCPGELIKVRNPSSPLYASNYTTYQYFNGGFGTNFPDLSRAATAPTTIPIWGCLTLMKSDKTVFAHGEPSVKKAIRGMNVVYPDGRGAWVPGFDIEPYWTGPSGDSFYWPKRQTNQ